MLVKMLLFFKQESTFSNTELDALAQEKVFHIKPICNAGDN